MSLKPPFGLRALAVMSICLACGIVAAAAHAEPESSPDYWPTEAWRSAAPEAQGMDSRLLLEMMQTIGERKLAIDSLTIVRNGYIVLDAYFHPFDGQSKHIIESVTKNVTSALIGIALDKGHLETLDQPILPHLANRSLDDPDDAKKDISVRHLLTMTSGLDTRDSYQHRYAGFYDMLASGNWVQHVLDRPLARAPGEAFEYSNGAAHLLSAVLQDAVGMNMFAFARKHLFAPLGINDVSWSSDPQGVTVGEGQMMLTPRDLAKFGLLYLNRGRWDGRQVVSQAWVEASTRKQVSSVPIAGYGYLWWVDPSGYYLAMGHLGQFLFVVPEKRLVVVATGHLKGGQFFAPQQMLDQFIIPAAVSDEALPAQPAVNDALAALVAEVAEEPAEGFTWETEGGGVAKDGLYKNESPVRFSFRYPKTSRKSRTVPGQIMAMRTQFEGRLGASAKDIPDGVALAAVGPAVFADELRDEHSIIEVRSNREIALPDGTPAYRTDIDWQSTAFFATRILLVSAFVGDKWVYLTYAVHRDYHEATLDELIAEGASIVESLTFNGPAAD